MRAHLLHILLTWLAMGVTAMAQEAAFSPALDGICSLGNTRAIGCDAIRAREIVDASDPQWSAIGRVNYASGDLRSHCTGTLVSNRTVLTAAHCLWNATRKRWIPAESLQFVPGYQRGQGLATSGVDSIILAPQIDTAAPRLRITPSHDWALLILSEPLGNRFGTIRLFGGRLRASTQGTALMPGYASLSPHVLRVAHDCDHPLPVSGQLLAACSAMPGDSGAPLLWVGTDGLGQTGTFLLGTTTAVSAATAPMTTRFAPWFRLRDAVETEILMGN
ncbi:trypsin-like serine protease [Alisedimentitalea sp. MJ-SS2]|uniref:trypsin-like serine peptidase n=1 Tax=Aliisedimentitalea sp. MJ-SS2 TaxID=3049795 RepID=UPI0029061EE2|nr:trypsin-like serine protease [Alisedimentitalea sp. MJ-SS2]MDU8926524.1 trypsin-like serine protease [Alisedimentitalea sp. MJ-SS2]